MDKKIKKIIMVAITESDSLIPQIAFYAFENKKLLISDLKEVINETKDARGEVNSYATDKEIKNFVNSLCGLEMSLTLVEDDYEKVVTAVVCGIETDEAAA